jgi:hypothetical protein
MRKIRGRAEYVHWYAFTTAVYLPEYHQKGPCIRVESCSQSLQLMIVIGAVCLQETNPDARMG